jgi:hypothetical protein
MLLLVLTAWLERREREAIVYLIEENRCPSRIRCQAATGSWTKSRSGRPNAHCRAARSSVCPLGKVDGVWPSNDTCGTVLTASISRIRMFASNGALQTAGHDRH